MNAKYWPCDFVNSYSANCFVGPYQPSNASDEPRRSSDRRSADGSVALLGRGSDVKPNASNHWTSRPGVGRLFECMGEAEDGLLSPGRPDNLQADR